MRDYSSAFAALQQIDHRGRAAAGLSCTGLSCNRSHAGTSAQSGQMMLRRNSHPQAVVIGRLAISAA